MENEENILDKVTKYPAHDNENCDIFLKEIKKAKIKETDIFDELKEKSDVDLNIFTKGFRESAINNFILLIEKLISEIKTYKNWDTEDEVESRIYAIIKKCEQHDHILKRIREAKEKLEDLKNEI